MPRVGFPGGPRLEWYDRNAVQQTMGYNAVSVAPHSATVRATYTVPTGKKALTGGCQGHICRDTAPTTAGLALIIWGYVAQSIMTVSHYNAAVGSSEESNVTLNGLMLAGETLNISTLDASTGGTMRYSTAVTLVEFDA